MKQIKGMLLAVVPMALMAVPVATSVPLLNASASAQALSPAVGNALKAAQASAKAGNIAAAEKQINTARGAAKTAAERQKVGEMAAYVYTTGRQYGKAAAELERVGASPRQLAPLYYQAGQYDKAIAAANRSGQTTIVAQSYVKQGKNEEAAKIYSQIVARNPNNAAALQNLAGVQYKMGDRKAYVATITKLLRIDPTPNRWRSVLLGMRDGPRASQLGVYHLMKQTGALKETEYQDYAKLAILGGQSGAVVELLSEADDPMMKNMKTAASQRQAAALKAAPASAKNPETALAAGDAYFGAGQYPAAVAAYAIAEKGPKAELAKLSKGIAQVYAGQLSAAKASFNSVTSDDLSNIANMWSLYVTTKGS